MALGRNGDQTCGCLLSWRERVLISLVTKDFLRRIPPVAGRSSEGTLTEPTADARTGQSARQGCDRSKPPTNRDTERPAQRRSRAEPKQEAGRLTGRPPASGDYPIECVRRCPAPWGDLAETA